MSLTRRRTAVLFSCVLLLLAATGCIGSFELTSGVHDWNMQVGDSRWVREGLFLLLVIVPVYELCLLGDALLFNTIEFWSGDNLLAAAPPLPAALEPLPLPAAADG